MAAQRLDVCLVGVVPRATQSPLPQSTTSQKRPLHPIHTACRVGEKKGGGGGKAAASALHQLLKDILV